jgi:hypothetical protein
MLQAGRARRLPNAYLATTILLLILMFAFMIVAIANAIATGGEETQSAPTGAVSFQDLTIPFVLIVPLLASWLAVYEKRRLGAIGLAPRSAAPGMLSGLAVGVAMVSGTAGLMILLGAADLEPGGDRLTGAAATGSASLMLGVFLLQAGSEEMLFRGWYLSVLGARHSAWIGILVSSAAFSALHAPTHPIAILNLFLFGLFAAFYCLREGNIWGVWGFHAGWNWAEGSLFGMALSGHEVPGGALINLRATGSSMFSGGDYGPEASLVRTLFLLAAIAVVLAWPPRRTST